MGTPSLAVPRARGASNILVGWLCPGDVTNAFASSLVDTICFDPLRRIQGKISMQASPRIAEVRNELVENFLNKTTQDWLLMIDADMAWDFEDFDRVCRSADEDTRPIVGGLCFGGGRVVDKLNIFPTLYNIKKNEDGELRSHIIRKYPRNTMYQVSATGAAFLLVHRKVFIRIFNHIGQGNPYPWFQEAVLGGNKIGEDITFCVRATSADFKIYVHTGARIRHEKRFYLTEEEYDRANIE